MTSQHSPVLSTFLGTPSTVTQMKAKLVKVFSIILARSSWMREEKKEREKIKNGSGWWMAVL